MGNTATDTIIENLFNALPLIHRKLLKIDLTTKGISRLHFVILRILDEFGMLPVSEIGKRLLIPKPQMTHLINRLIVLGMVERLPDTKDRRIINMVLTDKGKITLEECKELIRSNIRRKLSRLKEEELAELSTSLRKLIDLGSRLE